MTHPATFQLRFSLKYLFVAVLITSVVLSTCLLFLRWQHHSAIVNVYRNSAVYQALRTSRRFELFRVQTNDYTNSAISDWKIPNDDATFGCGSIEERDAERFRERMVTPENFKWRVNGFVFHPTYLMRSTANGRQLDIYFCFRSENNIVGWLTTNTVASELNELFSSVCEER